MGGQGAGVAAVDPQVDRDVQHPGALGEIHAEEEDVRPAAVREVQPHGRPLDQDREQRVLRLAAKELAMDAQGMLVRAADPEHPPVALTAPDRSPDLVGQVLEGDLLVGLRQALQMAPLGPSRRIASRNAAIACSYRRSIRSRNPAKGISPDAANLRGVLDLVAIQGVEEQRSPDPLVEVARASCGSARAPRRRVASPSRLAVAISSRIERSRTDGSAWVIVSMRSSPTGDGLAVLDSRGDKTSGPPMGCRTGLSRRVLLDPDDRLQQQREDPLPVGAGQGQGDLGLDARRT